jgi:hypothetical protein
MNIPAIATGLVIGIILSIAAVYSVFNGTPRERLYIAIGVVALSMLGCGVAFFVLFYGSGAAMYAILLLAGVE